MTLDKFTPAIAWVLARAQEPSTWAGVATLIASVVGHELAPEYTNALLIVGPAIAGMLIAVSEKHGVGSAMSADTTTVIPSVEASAVSAQAKKES